MAQSNDRGLQSSKEDLSDWYSEILIKSGFIDFSPVGGFIVLLPPAAFIWEKIREYMNKEMEKMGVKNSYFPLLIPESLLKKESEHFTGFTPEVAWVTEAGDQKLEERLAVRPTSETIMYTMYSKWIHGTSDLPLKLNQWNSVVRWETSSTRPFIRTKEFLWQEAHTAHATEDEALKQAQEALDLYEKVLKDLLAIPVIKGRKTEKEKFKGAVFTYTLEAMMPDGKAIQMATSHMLGQNFSVPFEITYVDEKGNKHYVWQTSWGLSWRVIGAMIMLHGDSKGLVIPPEVAPLQVVLVPIIYRDKQDPTPRARELARELQLAGIRAYVDERNDKTPGYKYNEWEMRGVPLRIEIGPRDVEHGTMVLARRDTGEKSVVNVSDAAATVKSVLSNIQKSLYEKAKAKLVSMINEVSTLEELSEAVKNRRGFSVVNLCDERECEDKIYDTTGATVRCVEETAEGKCIVCGRPARYRAYVSKAY
ncbi:MAG TPA: proline--tRNA ligase [Thermoprotei archaeon]|nr:proline--tRNA ligase [Thermoprotei archaeon]